MVLKQFVDSAYDTPLLLRHCLSCKHLLCCQRVNSFPYGGDFGFEFLYTRCCCFLLSCERFDSRILYSLLVFQFRFRGRLLCSIFRWVLLLGTSLQCVLRGILCVYPVLSNKRQQKPFLRILRYPAPLGN